MAKKSEPSYFPCLVALAGFVLAAIGLSGIGFGLIGVAIAFGIYDLGKLVADR